PSHLSRPGATRQLHPQARISGQLVARGQAGPVGTWKLEYEVGGQKREATLAIKKDGDKLAGKMTWQDKKESKLTDVKLKDGKLTFSAEREINDMKFTINYKLKVDGEVRDHASAGRLLISDLRPSARRRVHPAGLCRRGGPLCVQGCS